MKHIFKMYHFKNSRLYDALNSGEIECIRQKLKLEIK